MTSEGERRSRLWRRAVTVWATLAVVGAALTVWLQDAAETRERPKGWYATQDPAAPLLHMDVSDAPCPRDTGAARVTCAWTTTRP